MIFGIALDNLEWHLVTWSGNLWESWFLQNHRQSQYVFPIVSGWVNLGHWSSPRNKRDTKCDPIHLFAPWSRFKVCFVDLHHRFAGGFKYLLFNPR
jgi:hypothetical protein